MKAEDVAQITTRTTKKWTKQRKKEERNCRARVNRRTMYNNKVCFTDVASDIIPDAHAKVSASGRLPASVRQIYFAARPSFLEQVGRSPDYKYFSQTLLRQYINRHPVTDSWRITSDDRGRINEPHTGHSVLLGTLQVDKYLDDVTAGIASNGDICATLATDFPTIGTANRISAVLYIEKEGFAPLLKATRIAERYDLAIMSC